MNPLLKIVWTALSIAARVVKHKVLEAEKDREDESEEEDALTVPPSLEEEMRRYKNKNNSRKN